MHVCICKFHCCSLHMFLACHGGPNACIICGGTPWLCGPQRPWWKAGLVQTCILWQTHCLLYIYSFCWFLTWHLCRCSAQEQAAPSCMQHAFMHPTPMHACMHALQSCCVVFTHSCRPCPFLSVDPWWDCWWTPTCLRRDLTCTLPTVSSVKHMHDMHYIWLNFQHWAGNDWCSWVLRSNSLFH